MRSWRTSPATAWEHPLVEWARTATSYCSIVLDCDSREKSRTRVCGRGGLRRSAEAHLLRRWPSVAELGTSARSSRTISCPGRRSIKRIG